MNVLQRVHKQEIKGLCGVIKGIIHRTEDGLLWYFGHLERMKQNRMTMKVHKAGGENKSRGHSRVNREGTGDF